MIETIKERHNENNLKKKVLFCTSTEKLNFVDENEKIVKLKKNFRHWALMQYETA